MTNVVLISTYELGRQPFGLASPAAWLRRAGAHVTCFDLSVDHLNDDAIRGAHLVAFYLPMHTATRLAIPIIKQVHALNPHAHLCAYGLYAPLNEKFLSALGVQTILGGEFEEALVALLPHPTPPLSPSPLNPHPHLIRRGEKGLGERSGVIPRQQFLVPDRAGLPPLTQYARLNANGAVPRVTGYTETTRGCQHLCRHCPIVPVYGGQFRIVQREVVLADIRQQIAAGAQHITFGDPDFFNGAGHVIPIVEQLHHEFPAVTYDVTIKIEHLLKHADRLSIVHDTGCLFVTSAVESVDDRILQILDKGHTRADFIRAAALMRHIGLTLVPTFVTFNPWIALAGYRDLLALVAELDLLENVAPIQWAIRLLIPEKSRLLELPDVRALVGAFDAEKLCYPWAHPDPRVDELQRDVLNLVQAAQKENASRREVFARVWARVFGESPRELDFSPAQPVPHLSEPWYC